MNITLAQLEYIVSVDTYRHFVTAAEKCFVTQPTLSMQIKKLEDVLGVVVFDRNKQPIVPTEAGAAIIAQARKVINDARKIDDIIMNFKEQVSGTLRLGIIPTLAPYALPYFVGRFINKHPNVKLEVKELMTHQILDALRRDTIDLGLLVTPLSGKEWVEIPLFYEEFKLYVNEKHKLIGKNKVDIEEIDTEELWLLAEGHCFRNQVINLCPSNTNVGKHSNFQYESGSLETLKKIVDTEGGSTLLPDLATTDIRRHHPERLKPIGSIHPFREVSLIHNKNFAKTKLLDLLINTIKTTIPNRMLQMEQGEIIEWEK
ncbi:transcriptional regulator [Fulvitalea axinellae]|uniref:Transcriptional regulator n=1 Tax=Fulvitalea axinellae TaxID=1182444 RepID=A0AAU9DEA2_9BACT|nr:transcriptional regulator [Fulvitalea axinellae]